MADQATLFDPPAAVAPAKPLTDRQQYAFDLVRQAGRAGMSADEVGAELCARKGKHSIDDRCEWCAKNGRDLLARLRQLGHVKSRRDGSWYALHDVIEPEKFGEGIPF